MRYVAASADFAVILHCHECGLYSKEGAGCKSSLKVLELRKDFISSDYGSIVTRLRFPSHESLQPAYDTLQNCGVPRSALIVNDQSNCDCVIGSA